MNQYPQLKPPSKRNAPHLEIQIHLSDIQKGVRYLFLSRRQIHLAAVGFALFLLFLGFNLTVAPRVITNLLNRQEYHSLLAARTKLGSRLDGLNQRLLKLQENSEELQLNINKIFLAYGLSNDVSIGQGGYPLEAMEVPDSIFRQKIAQTALLEVELKEQVQVLDTFMAEIQAFEKSHRDQVRSTPSISPLKGSDFVLTSPFAYRISPFTKKRELHSGIDLAAPRGTPIYAPADGKVVFAGQYPMRLSAAWWRYGNLVSIRHGERFITLFGHCDKILVKAGQSVKQGDRIATVGHTGWSTSPHLHYEIRLPREDGELAVDPRIYILDHRWRDDEQILIQARRAPEPTRFDPLPRRIIR